jgi:hypothetical protein
MACRTLPSTNSPTRAWYVLLSYFGRSTERLIHGQPLSESARLALERLCELKENLDAIALNGKTIALFPRPAVPAMGALMLAVYMYAYTVLIPDARVVFRRARGSCQRQATLRIPQYVRANRKHGQVLRCDAHTQR